MPVYASDWLSSERRHTMTFEARGLYWDLLLLAWKEHGLPSDLRLLAKMHGLTNHKFRLLWSMISPCFYEKSGRFLNEKQEQVRAELISFRLERERTGRLGGHQKAANRTKPPSSPTIDLEVNPSSPTTDLEKIPRSELADLYPSSSSSSSSSSTEEPKGGSSVRRAPLIVSPLGYDRIHGQHVVGFCDWCCLPEFLRDNFANNADWTHAQVVSWASEIRRTWTGPRGDELKFWRARWNDAHPQKAAATLGSKNKATLERFMQRHGDES